MQPPNIKVTVRKKAAKKERRPSIEIAPHTYVPVEGHERDIVHYLFTKESLTELQNKSRSEDITGEKWLFFLLSAYKRCNQSPIDETQEHIKDID